MSATFDRICELLIADDWQGSDHALQRLADYDIIVSDLLENIEDGVPIEDNPNFHAGPCVLVLQHDQMGPVHALWGLKLGTDRPAVLITAYRPDPAQWLDDNRTRRS